MSNLSLQIQLLRTRQKDLRKEAVVKEYRMRLERFVCDEGRPDANRSQSSQQKYCAPLKMNRRTFTYSRGVTLPGVCIGKRLHSAEMSNIKTADLYVAHPFSASSLTAQQIGLSRLMGYLAAKIRICVGPLMLLICDTACTRTDVGLLGISVKDSRPSCAGTPVFEPYI